MTEADYLERGESVLANLQESGGELNPRLERHFVAGANKNVPRVQIGRDPVSHLILELSKNGWPELIQESVELANRLGYWLELMLFQIDYYHSKPRQKREQIYDQISLASRRHLLFCTADYRYADPAYREQLFADLDRLPRPSLRSTVPELIPASKLLISEFRRWEHKIECCDVPGHSTIPGNEIDSIHEDEEPLVPIQLTEDEVATAGRFRGALKTENETFGGRSAQAVGLDAALTRMQAPVCLIEPAAYCLLHKISALEKKNGFASIKTSKLLFFLFWSLEIYHGIPFLDAAQLGLFAMTRFGQITENELILNLASGYYPAARDAWESKPLPLPLARECCAILSELRRRKPQAKTLGDFRHKNLKDEHRLEVKNYLREAMPGFKGSVVHVFRIFEKVAKIQLDLPSSEIGLLKGKPLLGGRGEAAYISKTHEFLVKRLVQNQGQIRENGGLPCDIRPFPVTQEVYGTTALTFTEFWTKTRNLVTTSNDINSIMACLVRFTRGLGYRTYGEHFNPWRWLREEPILCLEFRDKVVAGWQAPRYVWISPAIKVLIRTCGELFGDLEHLPYSWQGETVQFASLSSKREQERLQEILRDNRQHNAGRTALYNALRQLGVGEVLRQVIMGHGPIASHLFGCHMPVCPRRLLEMTAEFLGPLFEREGVDEVALMLAEKLRRCVSASTTQYARAARQDQAAVAIRHQAPRSVHVPPSFEEWAIRRRVLFNLSQLQYGCMSSLGGKRSVRRKSIASYPANETGLLGIIALDLGLPLKHLLTFQKYYTWDSFVLERNSGKIYFLAVGRHGDVGGLFRYPIFVCLATQARTDRLMRLVRYTLARALRRQRRRTKIKPRHKESVLRQPIFADASLTQSSIGKGLKFLLAEPGQRCLLTNREVFGRLNRVSDTSCALRHPGLVAAVFSGRSPMGLNHFNLNDLLAPGGSCKARLETLLHTEFKDRLALESHEMGKPATEIAATGAHPRSANEWFDIFKKTAQVPSKRLFYNAINGVLNNPARSAVLVNHVMNKFTTAGLLQTSRPLPLIQAGEWDGIMARVHDHIEHRARPKLGGMNARLDGVTRELLMADQQFFFRLVETTLSRPQEIADLKWTNVFEINGRIFLHCPQGKTSAARRTIDVGLLHPGGEGYRELIQEILQRSATRREPPPLFEAVSRHYRGKKAHTKNPSRYLRSATGRADLKVYDLRHNGLIQVLGSALDDRLRHGNFHSWLCLLSVSMGHQALSVTLNTYIGTAAHVFNV